MDTTTNSVLQTEGTAQPVILLTGATGSVGKELTNILSEQGVPFRVMVRTAKDVETFSKLPGVEAVMGDFNDPLTITQALKGMKRAFLLTNSSEQSEKQQLAFVNEAQRAGLEYIVKLSQLAADAHSPVRFLRYHAVVEQAIQASGMAYTFLRPNLFMQGLLGFRSSIAEQGAFFAAIGDAKVSVIDVRDIAAVAAAALTKPGHEGRIYTLTGPQSLTHAEVADELSSALGRPVAFVSIPPDAMQKALTEIGFPAWQADGLIEDYAHYDRNEASMITSAVEEVTGKPARSFASFARDYAPTFS